MLSTASWRNGCHVHMPTKVCTSLPRLLSSSARAPACSSVRRRNGEPPPICRRSEEHTSELQSRLHLVCRLLLEKKKKNNTYHVVPTANMSLEPRRAATSA